MSQIPFRQIGAIGDVQLHVPHNKESPLGDKHLACMSQVRHIRNMDHTRYLCVSLSLSFKWQLDVFMLDPPCQRAPVLILGRFGDVYDDAVVMSLRWLEQT